MHSRRVSDGRTLLYRITRLWHNLHGLEGELLGLILISSLCPNSKCVVGSEVLPSETVAGMDACVKLTGTYSQRVSDGSTLLWQISYAYSEHDVHTRGTANA